LNINNWANAILTIKEFARLTVLHACPIKFGAFISFFVNTFWRSLLVLAEASFFFDAKFFVANNIIIWFAVFNTPAIHSFTWTGIRTIFPRDLTKTWVVRINIYANILASRELAWYAVLGTFPPFKGTFIVNFLRACLNWTFTWGWRWVVGLVSADAAIFRIALISVATDAFTCLAFFNTLTIWQRIAAFALTTFYYLRDRTETRAYAISQAKILLTIKELAGLTILHACPFKFVALIIY